MSDCKLWLCDFKAKVNATDQLNKLAGARGWSRTAGVTWPITGGRALALVGPNGSHVHRDCSVIFKSKPSQVAFELHSTQNGFTALTARTLHSRERLIVAFDPMLCTAGENNAPQPAASPPFFWSPGGFLDFAVLNSVASGEPSRSTPSPQSSCKSVCHSKSTKTADVSEDVPLFVCAAACIWASDSVRPQDPKTMARALHSNYSIARVGSCTHSEGL